MLTGVRPVTAWRSPSASQEIGETCALGFGAGVVAREHAGRPPVLPWGIDDDHLHVFGRDCDGLAHAPGHGPDELALLVGGAPFEGEDLDEWHENSRCREGCSAFAATRRYHQRA